MLKKLQALRYMKPQLEIANLRIHHHHQNQNQDTPHRFNYFSTIQTLNLQEITSSKLKFRNNLENQIKRSTQEIC